METCGDLIPPRSHTVPSKQKHPPNCLAGALTINKPIIETGGARLRTGSAAAVPSHQTDHPKAQNGQHRRTRRGNRNRVRRATLSALVYVGLVNIDVRIARHNATASRIMQIIRPTRAAECSAELHARCTPRRLNATERRSRDPTKLGCAAQTRSGPGTRTRVPNVARRKRCSCNRTWRRRHHVDHGTATIDIECPVTSDQIGLCGPCTHEKRDHGPDEMCVREFHFLDSQTDSAKHEPNLFAGTQT